MARKLLIIGVVLLIALAALLYLTPQGRSITGKVIGWARNAEDTATTNKVKSAFSLSKRLSAYEIEVATKDGIVTLTGRVPTEIDKELAASVTRDVPEVKSVDNKIEIEPGVKPSEASVREGMRVTDLEIRADLNEKLLASQALKGQTVQVAVQDRIVTLTGQVENSLQKTGADQLAKSITNVVEVVNNLQVADPAAARNETPGVPESVSKDKELANRVLFALFQEREDFADVGAIKAASRDGTVTMTGTVVSRAERALAERIARDVDGVRSISNQVTVKPK